MPGEPFLLPGENRANPAFRTWTPRLHPGAFETWSVRPWWRKATCAETGCQAHRQGWTTVVDETTDLGRQQADYIRHHSNRAYRVTRTEAGWTQFEFPAGQTCFDSDRHIMQADRPEVAAVQAGDHRATAGAMQVYDRVDQMVDDFRTRTDKIFTARSRAGTAE